MFIIVHLLCKKKTQTLSLSCCKMHILFVMNYATVQGEALKKNNGGTQSVYYILTNLSLMWNPKPFVKYPNWKKEDKLLSCCATKTIRWK